MTLKLTISERLAYSTVRIECNLASGDISVGTGFFFHFCQRNRGDPYIPAIVTNRHVVTGAETGVFYLTLSDTTGSPEHGKRFAVAFEAFEKAWTYHPNEEIDLSVLPMSRVVTEAGKKNKEFFYRALNMSLVPTSEELTELGAVEDVLMVGYPTGLWDESNNLPLFRKGITATDPKFDFNGRPEFLIDIACFQGSSGSPVFLYNPSVYRKRSGAKVSGTRLKLLGVLQQMAARSVEGEIKIVNVPTTQVPVALTKIPLNLGIVVKANALKEFEPLLESMAEKRRS